MPSWDLSTKGNWELLVSEQQAVVYTDNTTPANNSYKYTPISPIYTLATTHTLLVGVGSNSAREHWFLGARVSQFLYVSPSSTIGLMAGVQAEGVKKVGLGKLTLVEFKNYNVTPYVVEVAIPYWLEDVYIEVWQYNGLSNDLQDVLVRLEEKIDYQLGQ